MAAMVTFVALWIFIYSLGYMQKEKRFGRFFGFLSLFCGAMLMVVLSNSLLLLFMAWELVGLASYLLIGFYYEKPSAAAAAQKAFITTRVGDMAFFLGMIWLYGHSGTLLFYDGGNGLLESGALSSLAGSHHHRRAHGFRRGLAAAAGRRDGQIRPGSAAHLAARRDGRPDAGFRADPRRDDGGRRCVPRRPHPPDFSRGGDAGIAFR
jgi:hypothetical protein